MVGGMARRLSFTAWALVVAPGVSLLVFIGLFTAGLGTPTIGFLIVLPALITLVAALRLEQPNWVVAVSPVLSVVLAVAGAFVYIAYFTERPFD